MVGKITVVQPEPKRPRRSSVVTGTVLDTRVSVPKHRRSTSLSDTSKEKSTRSQGTPRERRFRCREFFVSFRKSPRALGTSPTEFLEGPSTSLRHWIRTSFTGVRSTSFGTPGPVLFSIQDPTPKSQVKEIKDNYCNNGRMLVTVYNESRQSKVLYSCERPLIRIIDLSFVNLKERKTLRNDHTT